MKPSASKLSKSKTLFLILLILVAVCLIYFFITKPLKGNDIFNQNVDYKYVSISSHSETKEIIRIELSAEDSKEINEILKKSELKKRSESEQIQGEATFYTFGNAHEDKDQMVDIILSSNMTLQLMEGDNSKSYYMDAESGEKLIELFKGIEG